MTLTRAGPARDILSRLATVGRRTVLIAACAGVTSAASAVASAAQDFYAGKTLTILAGFQAGSGYDTYMRSLARHIAKHIPGNPTIVPSNMTGGGGLVLANYLYNVAAKDGTSFGIFSRSNNLDPLFETPSARFDPRKFQWIGSMGDEVSVCIAWHQSPFKTWNDLIGKEFVATSTSNSADTGVYPALFNAYLGTKFKVVHGYKGGPAMSKAIESGEANGRCGWSWTSVKATKPEWIADKKINVLVQAGLRKAKDLQHVPLALEFAKTDRQRAVLELAFTPQAIAWGFAAPPQVPADRLAILRKAFLATLADKEFLAEAERLKLGIDPMTGEDVAKEISKLYAAPKDVVDAARAIMKPLQK
jgi:tripartite-type tricarboxylate transporter receptor subunit TctC